MLQHIAGDLHISAMARFANLQHPGSGGRVDDSVGNLRCLRISNIFKFAIFGLKTKSLMKQKKEPTLSFATCRNGGLGHAPRLPVRALTRKCRRRPRYLQFGARGPVKSYVLCPEGGEGGVGRDPDERTCAESSTDLEELVSKAACSHPQPLAPFYSSHLCTSSRAQVSDGLLTINQLD